MIRLRVLSSLLLTAALLVGGHHPSEEPHLNCGWDPSLRIASPWEDPMYRRGAPVFGVNDDTNNQFLAGKVVINVVLVESDGSIEPSTDDWTPAERTFAMDVTKAMEDRLLALAPPQSELQFVRNPAMNPITISTGYEPVGRMTVEARDNGKQAEWVSDVFEKLGSPVIGQSWGEIARQARKLNVQIRNENNADWSIFVICVAGGPTTSFGRGEYVLNTGPSTINATNFEHSKRIFMHELAHAFGANHCLPESALYGAPGVAGFLGYYSGKSAPPCLMSHTSADTFCWFNHVPEGSQGQIGWTDLDQDGLLDILDTRPELTYKNGLIATEGMRHRLNGGPKLAFRQKIVGALARRPGQPWQTALPTDGAFDSPVEGIQHPGAAGENVLYRAHNQYGNHNSPAAYSSPKVQMATAFATGGVPDVTVSPDGKFAAFTYGNSNGSTCRVVNLETGVTVKSFSGPYPVFWQGKLVVGRGDKLEFYNPATWALEKTIVSTVSNLWLVKPVANGQLLAVSFGEGRTLIFRPGDTAPWKTLPIASYQIEVTPDLANAITTTWGGSGESLKWRLSDVTSSPFLSNGWARMAMDSDGTIFYSNGRWVYRLKPGATEPDLIEKNHEDYIRDIAVVSDAGLVVLELYNGEIVMRRLSDLAYVGTRFITHPVDKNANLASGGGMLGAVSNTEFRAYPLPPRYTYDDRAKLAAIDIAPTVKAGAKAAGTVTLATPAPVGGLSVGLSWDGGAASVPDSVFVPGGAMSANFEIDGSLVSAETNGTVYAQLNTAFLGKPIKAIPAVLTEAVASPTSVGGGTSATLTVKLDGGAPAGGASVSLAPSSTEWALPAAITIPAGAAQASVLAPTTGVAVAKTIVVKATYAGVEKSTSLTVNPAALTTLSVTPSTVEAGKPVTAKVTLDGFAPPAGAVVSLTSSSTNLVVPPTATVPSGEKTASVVATTKVLTARATALVTATYRGVSRSVVVTLDPLLLSQFTLTPATLAGGGTSVAKVQLSRPAPPEGATLTILSNKAQAPAPKTLKVAAGATSATFSIKTVAVPADVTASLSATFRSRTLTRSLLIQAPRLASLVRSAASVPGGSTTPLDLTATLTGPAPAGGTTVTVTSTSTSLPGLKIVVAAGTTSKKVRMTHRLVPANVSATLSATVLGVKKTALVTLTPVSLLALGLTPSTAPIGTTFEIKATLSHPLAYNGFATLTFDATKILGPTRLDIGVGAKFGTVAALAKSVPATVKVPITGKFNGFTKVATLTIKK